MDDDRAMDDAARRGFEEWEVMWRIREALLRVPDVETRREICDRAIQVANEQWPEWAETEATLREFLKDML
jgi:hypothetical protein